MLQALPWRAVHSAALAAPGRGPAHPCRPCRAIQRQPRQARQVATAGIKAVEGYDGSFELDTVSQEVLEQLLQNRLFLEQVVSDCQLGEDARVEWTGILFQPVPWSPATKRGMPAEYERYLDDPAYTVINVPPNFMFKAKIFKPPRLCTIYKRVTEEQPASVPEAAA